MFRVLLRMERPANVVPVWLRAGNIDTTAFKRLVTYVVGGCVDDSRRQQGLPGCSSTMSWMLA